METPIRIAKPAERGADLRVSGRARERRIVSTRVPNGRVLPVYGNKGGGKTLMEAGAVMADNLSPQKARILAMLLLQAGVKPEEMQKFFDR
jgi:L-asparaginase